MISNYGQTSIESSQEELEKQGKAYLRFFFYLVFIPAILNSFTTHHVGRGLEYITEIVFRPGMNVRCFSFILYLIQTRFDSDHHIFELIDQNSQVTRIDHEKK